jgi:hypothetical protein
MQQAEPAASCHPSRAHHPQGSRGVVLLRKQVKSVVAPFHVVAPVLVGQGAAAAFFGLA